MESRWKVFRFLFGVVSLSLSDIRTITLGQEQNPCHTKGKLGTLACSTITLPQGFCKACGVGAPIDSLGRYNDCTRTSGLEDIFGNTNQQCWEKLQDYVQMNPCDTPRAKGVSFYSNTGNANAREKGRQRLDYFVYSICEESCDCIPQVQLDPTVKSVDVHRGNCQAHAYYDICRVLPNITLVKQEGTADEAWPPVCPMIKDWFQNSGDGLDFLHVPNTPVVFEVERFFNRLIEATDLLNPSDATLWDQCVHLEKTQGRINISMAFEPSASPLEFPSFSPTGSPSLRPSFVASVTPSVNPSRNPSLEPSIVASASPSMTPSIHPSLEPSIVASASPSVNPSNHPSFEPSIVASVTPSVNPSRNPSLEPSIVASVTPSVNPSRNPSLEPSIVASASPSVNPSIHPSFEPSIVASASPSMTPSNHPSFEPSIVASASPSVNPEPSISPSVLVEPSTRPTVVLVPASETNETTCGNSDRCLRFLPRFLGQWYMVHVERSNGRCWRFCVPERRMSNRLERGYSCGRCP